MSNSICALNLASRTWQSIYLNFIQKNFCTCFLKTAFHWRFCWQAGFQQLCTRTSPKNASCFLEECPWLAKFTLASFTNRKACQGSRFQRPHKPHTSTETSRKKLPHRNITFRAETVFWVVQTATFLVFCSSTHQPQQRSQPKISVANILNLSGQQYLVWGTASRSTKRQDLLEIVGG